jgi:hypothetical protein
MSTREQAVDLLNAAKEASSAADKVRAAGGGGGGRRLEVGAEGDARIEVPERGVADGAAAAAAEELAEVAEGAGGAGRTTEGE